MDIVIQKNIPLTLLRGLCVRGSWRPNKDCNKLTPTQLLRPRRYVFLVLLGCSTGAWGPSLSSENWFPQLYLEHWLQALNSSCLTFCLTRLYNCFTSTQFNPSTVRVIPWSLRPDAPVIYTGAFLIWQLGQVGGQYATVIMFSVLYHAFPIKILLE